MNNLHGGRPHAQLGLACRSALRDHGAHECPGVNRLLDVNAICYRHGAAKIRPNNGFGAQCSMTLTVTPYVFINLVFTLWKSRSVFPHEGATRQHHNLLISPPASYSVILSVHNLGMAHFKNTLLS